MKKMCSLFILKLKSVLNLGQDWSCSMFSSCSSDLPVDQVFHVTRQYSWHLETSADNHYFIFWKSQRHTHTKSHMNININYYPASVPPPCECHFLHLPQTGCQFSPWHDALPSSLDHPLISGVTSAGVTLATPPQILLGLVHIQCILSY